MLYDTHRRYHQDYHTTILLYYQEYLHGTATVYLREGPELCMYKGEEYPCKVQLYLREVPELCMYKGGEYPCMVQLYLREGPELCTRVESIHAWCSYT